MPRQGRFAERCRTRAAASGSAKCPAGEHTLRVSTVGYRMLSRPFPIAPGEAKDFDIMLTPDVLRRTETVEVRAGPFEVETEERPSRIALAGTEAKDLASVLADDLLRAVQALPGVASNDDFDAGLTRPVSPALCCSCSKSLSRKRGTCSR